MRDFSIHSNHVESSLCIAIYIMVSLILSALNVLISCILCWMVHGKYNMPERWHKRIKAFLGRLRIPHKKSYEWKVFEKELLQMRITLLDEISPKGIEFGKLDRREFAALEEPNDLIQLRRFIRRNEEVLNVRQHGATGSEQDSRYQSTQETHSPELEELKAIATRVLCTLQEVEDVRKNVRYLVMLSMQKKFEAERIAFRRMKSLAVILNRFAGILLTIVNVGMILFTVIEMLTS